MVGNTVIGTAPIAADWSRSASRVGAASRADAITGGVAFFGVLVLTTAAPFERTRPLIDLPGQSITNLEAALLLVSLAWGAANAFSRRLPEWRTPP